MSGQGYGQQQGFGYTNSGQQNYNPQDPHGHPPQQNYQQQVRLWQ